MENQHSFDQKGDNAEPDEELLSILEEIITEDELKNKGKQTLAINIRAIVSAIFTQWSFSSAIHLYCDEKVWLKQNEPKLFLYIFLLIIYYLCEKRGTGRVLIEL